MLYAFHFISRQTLEKDKQIMISTTTDYIITRGYRIRNEIGTHNSLGQRSTEWYTVSYQRMEWRALALA